jgi:hypothetical protein
MPVQPVTTVLAILVGLLYVKTHDANPHPLNVPAVQLRINADVAGTPCVSAPMEGAIAGTVVDLAADGELIALLVLASKHTRCTVYLYDVP